MRRFSWAVLVCAAWAVTACGGKVDGATDDAGAADAKLDAKPKPKDAGVDTSAPYQPIGKK